MSKSTVGSSIKTVLNRPSFSGIDYAGIEATLDDYLKKGRALVEKISANAKPTWEELIEPEESLHDELARFWSPVSHLNSVVNSDELRDAFNACLPKLSQYHTELGQNLSLFEKTQTLANSDAYKGLSAARKRTVDNRLRDFKLSGVALPEQQKKRYMEITIRLSELQNKFSENVLDSNNAWEKLITDESLLAGIPSHAIAAARERAEKENKEGWLINLEFPSYYAVITFADNEELRKELYMAYSTRASDQGPHDHKYNNDSLIDEILALRVEKAELLGFESFGHFSVETKMVESPQEVIGFLRDLAKRGLPLAQKEVQELKDFAKETDGKTTLNAWDVSYYSDKLKQQRYAISEEDLKPYFPASKAIPGMFAVVSKLFGVEINQVGNTDIWHDDVECYEIRDTSGELRGEFYMDNYARANKRGGAWMDVAVSRRRINDSDVQVPIAYLTCNLTPPVGNDPALLTHNEVTTLFHEFGHGLHHMLTRVDAPEVAGISGVEWDAVELPSQFLENWCWDREALDMISGHYKTDEKIPDDLLQKAQRAKNFQSAMQMMRQIEFSLFDMRIHSESKPGAVVDVQKLLNEVREEVAVLEAPDFNRFQNGFSHIFAGGYAAGYFSYKWAEVLSADAFARFEEEGIFNSETGAAFMQNILEKGGTEDAMVLFENFRGRKPKIDALLRHSGLAA